LVCVPFRIATFGWRCCAPILFYFILFYFSLCRMGILVIVTPTISESFWIIIFHKLN
jgi:hypothetical protein